MAQKDLECPQCRVGGQRVAVQPQPKSPYPAQYTLHRYKCTHCGKIYDTEERLKDDDPHVKVRGYDGPPPRFSEQRFTEDLKSHAPKRLRDSDYDLVRKQVLASIIAAGVADPRPGWVSVDDSDGDLLIYRADLSRLTLRAFIEVAKHHRHTDPALSARLDIGHIQYALATLGSSWRSAAEFLEWFRHVDHQGRRASDLAPQWRIEPVTWGVPALPPPTPITTVITNKFVKGLDPRTRETQPFKPAKLSEKLYRAFRGLPDGPAMAANVDMYVRWCLIGQRIVRTSQISTLISEALRALHDIAYLRWVMAGKELTPDTVFDEAVALLTFPSPRLTFQVNSPTLVRGSVHERI